MKLNGIHHCSVMVSDMDRAVEFYRDVMGLQEIEIPETFPPAGAFVHWFLMGAQHIHLMPASEPDCISPRHFALEIDNARAGRDHFKNKGLEVREQIPIPGADRFVISDPDGNNIELIEWQIPYQTKPVKA